MICSIFPYKCAIYLRTRDVYFIPFPRKPFGHIALVFVFFTSFFFFFFVQLGRVVQSAIKLAQG